MTDLNLYAVTITVILQTRCQIALISPILRGRSDAGIALTSIVNPIAGNICIPIALSQVVCGQLIPETGDRDSQTKTS